MAEKTEKEKMLAGELYCSTGPELMAELVRSEKLQARFNAIVADPAAQRAVLEELLGSLGPEVVIRPQFRCDYGSNIHIGRQVFINFNCVFLDCARIVIGDNVLIGPGVQLYTAGHPLDAAVRRAQLEFAHEIHIGKDAWLGGGSIVLGGVTIGEGAIVGAGSVVTRDVPPKSVVVGNPARVVRQAD